jgi:hypothetical protein
LLEGFLGVAAKTSQLITVGGAIGAGVLVYFILSYLFKLEEFQMVLGLVNKRIGMKRKSSSVQ